MKSRINRMTELIKMNWIRILLFFASVFVLLFCLPDPLFQDPVCTVVLDRNNQLLGARIAGDGQWRFPHNYNVPEKFQKAIICFEDKRFKSHPGIDPLAILRAFKNNIRNGEVTSGGSTLSMQVIRLSRKGKSRNLYEKVIEMILAVRMEISYSKDEILSLYASNAPFGANVVGLDAASWKYFGRNPTSLSWAETAMLAVLPNSPALIHPGRNRDVLKEKRDRLLYKLSESGVIDSLTCLLSQNEDLIDKPLPLPNYAPHLTERIRKENLLKSDLPSISVTTIDIQLQRNVTSILERHHNKLKENGIHNGAALVIDTETGNILSYVGNTSDLKNKHENSVDIISSKRSTGSILKPLLFAMMLHEGELLPDMLIPDIPTAFGNFSPKNFDRNYEGAVPARVALYRSLNIPYARMLNQYGTEKFYRNLKELGMTTLNKPSEHYGLSLILGGAETNLWDLGAMYSGMARLLKNHKTQDKSNYFRPLNYYLYKSNRELEINNSAKQTLLDPASIWHTFESMSEVVRPDAESNWQNFSSPVKIAWKTGTSFGFRDGWAVGCTPAYVVAVWVGNADGEGRANLTGIAAAAPLLFDIFDILKKDSKWFDMPLENMTEIKICTKSGHRANEYCTDTKNIFSTVASDKTLPCPYHKLIFLDSTQNYRVNSECILPQEMVSKSFFILPPIQEMYYKKRNSDYISLPAYRNDCKIEEEKSMDIIYPLNSKKIYIPVNLDGTQSKTVFHASHHNPNETIYWHIDDQFAGQTRGHHLISLCPEPGEHLLTLIDGEDETLQVEFEIIDRN